MSQERESKEEMVRLDWRLTGRGQIPCEVYEGMFPHERLIVIKIGEDRIQSFVHKDNLELEEDRGWVNVRVIDEKDEGLIINLPSEAVNSGQRQVVPKEMVRGTKVPKALVHEV